MKNLILLLTALTFTLNCFTQVKTGIEVLRSHNFKPLQNKKVGLITNPTGIDSKLHSTIDILYSSPKVKLTALYGPEHGVRGNTTAGEKIDNQIDPITKLPIYSLYGNTKKPTPEMLKNIDILVYDIQDIGSRSYTYISTLGLAMEAAAENNIEFMVLDRPNPLGGKKFEGAVPEPGFTSFVSKYPITYIHGFTIGELASFINNTGLLKNGIKCNLSIIKMEGWQRAMNFEQTGLPWVASSPHVPHAQTTYYYPASGILGELYVFNIGVGYTLPFELFGAQWLNAELLSENLNSLNIPGVLFRPIHYKPYYSCNKGQNLQGVQIYITNHNKAPLTLIQFYVLQEAYKLSPDKNVFELCSSSRLDMFDKVCGTDKIRKSFSKTFKVKDIIKLWEKDVKSFKRKAKKYFLYK